MNTVLELKKFVSGVRNPSNGKELSSILSETEIQIKRGADESLEVATALNFMQRSMRIDIPKEQRPKANPKVKVNGFKKAIDDFVVLQHKLGNFGAYDSEPSGYFYFIISKYVNEGRNILESSSHSVDSWELYSSMDGSRKAAQRLTAKAKMVIKAIDKATQSEVKEVLNYCGI